MRARPAQISDDELRGALSRAWRLDAAELVYSPVGAGGYHWVATDATGERYFVTVDDLDTKPWLGVDREHVYPSLQRCYESAWRLRHQAGLEFVTAPLPLDGDQRTVIERLNDRFSVAVFPFVDGAGIGRFDTPPEASREIVALLARLHAASGYVEDLAAERRLEIPAREALEGAMASTDVSWSSGPFADDAREWLRANAGAIGRGLRAYDVLAQQVSATCTPVITHGEPHAGNFMRVNGALVLVDWDTVAFAPPERDLWLCRRNGSDAGELYTRLTGHAVDPAAIRLFTIGWDLTDIALYVTELRNEHADSDDTRRAISVLQRMNVDRLA